MHIASEKEEVTRQAAQKLSSILQIYAREKIPVLFLVSGGSAFALLDGVDPSVFGPYLTIGVLDERYSEDPMVNNFSQLMKTHFYGTARSAGCPFIDTRLLQSETQEALRMRFEKALKQWRQDHAEGKIVITQGMGPDGHTSGVLPFSEDERGFIDTFNNPDHWTAAYDAAGKNPYPLRVTTTLSFLRQVDASILFVCGADKKEALKKVLAHEGSLAQTPARIINDMPQVFVFTDISL